MKAIGMVLLLAIAGCASKSSPTAAPGQASKTEPDITVLAKGALYFDDLGTHTRKVTTTNREAQRYFDQGLRLLYGFNHDEAARSFARAFQLDPRCAMCAWGVAYALGRCC